MISEIQGLHHVTSIASSAAQNNDFFSNTLGLRRVKATVNFDKPDVYHLYYGDRLGSPGTVMTYFPFEHRARGKRGVGEVGRTNFSVPIGALEFWSERLQSKGATALVKSTRFGENRLEFDGPDGDQFALCENEDDRVPFSHPDIPYDYAIRGFHSASMRLADAGASAELLEFMGYERLEAKGDVVRYHLPNVQNAQIIDLELYPNAAASTQGAGSVHHIAFAVQDRAEQQSVRNALLDTGYQVTGVRDRNYFYAIYFRSPGGVLFEVATNEPGFDFDEDREALGTVLKLPPQHEHLRDGLSSRLAPLAGLTLTQG